MSKLQQLKNLPITTKFILWFLFIALLPLAISTYISYNNSRMVLETEVTYRLLAVADNKAIQIESYLREKKASVTSLSQMSEILVAIERFDRAFNRGGVDSSEYIAAEREFKPLLTYHQRRLGYDNLFLIGADGDVIFSVSRGEGFRSIYELALYNKDSELAKAFIEAKSSLETRVSNFEYSQKTKEVALFIVAPISRAGEFVGSIVAQMSNQGLIELVGDYTGLGKTGEALLASKMGEEMVFITPLRFDAHAAFTKRIPIGSQEEVNLQKAVLGHDGTGVSQDYRGKHVLTVWRYLPTFRLGMVVKMDTVEVFAGANRLRNSLLRISSLLLLIVIFVAISIARSVSSPIKELTKISHIITGGNLLARAKINTEDEVGKLARSFNQMTDSLVEAKANVEKERAKLQEQAKLLEKANQELDSFVYTASHDLRAPLRGIASFAGFLQEDYKDKLGEEGRDHLSEIQKGIKRMNMLIEDLLKLSRISRIQNPYEDVDINALINSVIERIGFDIKERNVDLNIQENMPFIRCDRIKMAEVFLNLVNNAIKFSSKNNKQNPKVQIGYEDKGEFHRFYVKYNGIGIDPKHHQQIFGIFKRIHTDEEYEGTGAGLSIVKRVIDDHDGKIWVESELGRGATFYFTIPKGLRKEARRQQITIGQGYVSEEELKEALKKYKQNDSGSQKRS